MPEFGDQQLGRVLVDRLGERHGHAHLEQGLHQIGATLGHAVGELLDGDRLWNDDVAHLLGRRADLHVVPLFLLARASERGERASAAVVLVAERASDGEFAAMALFVAAAAARASGPAAPPPRPAPAATPPPTPFPLLLAACAPHSPFRWPFARAPALLPRA